jgi:predicted PurR-regulated permease PerM
MNSKQITRIVFLLLFVALLYFARGALLPIVLSLVLFYALQPPAGWISRLFPKKFAFGRDIAIIATFIIFILFVILAFEFIVPPFVEEFNQLSINLPQFIAQTQEVIRSSQQWYAGFRLPEEVNAAVASGLNTSFGYISSFLQQMVVGLIGILGQFIGLIVIPVIVYYMLKEEDTLIEGMMKIVPREHKEFLRTVLEKTNLILKNYVEGQIVICSLIGIVTGLGLFLLGVNFYLVLGLIAAVTELIPFIGPLIGAIPAVIIALLISPALAAKVIVFYIILQSAGAYVLLPRIMGKKLDLHPLTVLMALLILSNLIGVWGIFFAAPITAMLKVLYLELRKP